MPPVGVIRAATVVAAAIVTIFVFAFTVVTVTVTLVITLVAIPVIAIAVIAVMVVTILVVTGFVPPVAGVGASIRADRLHSSLGGNTAFLPGFDGGSCRVGGCVLDAGGFLKNAGAVGCQGVDGAYVAEFVVRYHYALHCISSIVYRVRIGY